MAQHIRRVREAIEQPIEGHIGAQVNFGEILSFVHFRFGNKMPNTGHGLERGVGIIVETAVVAILIGEVVPLLVEQGLFPRGLFWWIIPISIVSVVLTIDASRYWSWGYLGGVVIGIFIALPVFLDAGLLSLLDLLIYGGLAIGAIALRVRIHSSGF